MSGDYVIQQDSKYEKAIATRFDDWDESLPLFAINTVSNFGDSRKLENCNSWNRFLIEFDNISLNEQTIILRRNLDKISMGVYSGNKSIHMIVYLSNPPSTKEEYRFVHEYLIEKHFRGADSQCKDALRLSRTPNAIRYENGKEQQLLVNSLHPFKFKWETAYEIHLATKKVQELSFQSRERKQSGNLSLEAEAILQGSFPKGRRDEFIRTGLPSLFFNGYSYGEATKNLKESHNLQSIENYWRRLELSHPRNAR
jgi:hypothetical protein